MHNNTTCHCNTNCFSCLCGCDCLFGFSTRRLWLGHFLDCMWFTPATAQIQDAKDLHHLSLVGSYGAHLLHGFPPHFLHPTVTTSTSSASNPFSSSGGAFVKPFPSNLPLPSAFAPPTKCLGLEQVNNNSNRFFCFLLLRNIS